MTTSLVPSLQPISDGAPIPESTRVFFQERLRIRLHQFLLGEFVRRSRETGLTRKALAERIEKDAASITRWLGAPGNMELDTLSDLLLAMGLEPTFTGRAIVATQEVRNEDHGERAAVGNATVTLGELKANIEGFVSPRLVRKDQIHAHIDLNIRNRPTDQSPDQSGPWGQRATVQRSKAA